MAKVAAAIKANAKVAMVARAKDSSPGSSSSTTWVEATVDSGRVVVAKAEEATMVAVLSLRAAAMVVSGKEVVVDTINNRTDRAATEVVAKVAEDTTIKVVEEAIREEVQAEAAVAVVVEDNSEILPSNLPTL